MTARDDAIEEATFCALPNCDSWQRHQLWRACLHLDSCCSVRQQCDDVGVSQPSVCGFRADVVGLRAAVWDCSFACLVRGFLLGMMALVPLFAFADPLALMGEADTLFRETLFVVNCIKAPLVTG